MSEKVELVKTGIPGVDEMLKGGLPKGSITLVSGPPGIGKSNLGLQFVYNGATKFGENGVYIAVEDTPYRVKKYANAFGWDFEKLEQENKVMIIGQDISGVETESEITLRKAIKDVGAKRIVLDSITLFKYLFKDENERRPNILKFIKKLKKTGCTTVMIGEEQSPFKRIDYDAEHFLADGVMMLFWLRHKGNYDRAFRIVKMRGIEINTSIKPMKITSEGVIVYNMQEPVSFEE